MAVVPYEKRSYPGAAADTTLAGAINSSATTFTVASGAGVNYPDGSQGPFFVVLDYDTSTTEKVHCTARTGDVFTVDVRGVDGTAAQSHSNGAKLRACWTATDASEANTVANLFMGGAIGTVLSDVLASNLTSNAVMFTVGVTKGKWLVSVSAVGELTSGTSWSTVLTAAANPGSTLLGPSQAQASGTGTSPINPMSLAFIINCTASTSSFAIGGIVGSNAAIMAAPQTGYVAVKIA